MNRSEIAKRIMEKLARENGKIVIEWNKISEKQKEKVLENSQLYYIFVNAKLSKYNANEMKGLPDLNNFEDTRNLLRKLWDKMKGRAKC